MLLILLQRLHIMDLLLRMGESGRDDDDLNAQFSGLTGGEAWYQEGEGSPASAKGAKLKGVKRKAA